MERRQVRGVQSTAGREERPIRAVSVSRERPVISSASRSEISNVATLSGARSRGQ